jgi:hypothetical protein
MKAGSTNGKRIAIVEWGGSHDECLLSQFMALRNAGCETWFVSSPELWERNSRFQEGVNHFYPIEFTKKAISDFLLVRRLMKWFVEQGIEKVVFNTAQGAHVRNACFLASSKVEFIGVVHTLNKFTKSFTQRLIHRKINKYFVLNDYFLDRITVPKGLQVRSFYPLRFPSFEREVEKPTGEYWITVIGGVENRRKDLDGSIQLMKSLEHLPVRFIFLGKADYNHSDVRRFRALLEEEKLSERTVLFDAFIDEQTYDAYLKKSDFIWPMVHPETPSAQEYFKNQITGGMNVSFAHRIPMLVHEAYVKEWKDLAFAFSYSLATFRSDVERAIQERETMRFRMGECQKFNSEWQEEQYVRFIFGA